MSLVPSLLADFLTYVQDNLILMILCVVCLAAIIAILVILALTAKQAQKNQAEERKKSLKDSLTDHDTLPEELPPAVEGEVKETHDVPAPTIDNAPEVAESPEVAETVEAKEPVAPVTEPAEESVAPVEPVASAECVDSVEERETKAEETVVIVESPKETQEETKTNAPAEEKAKPIKKKIVVTTRHAEKAEKIEKKDSAAQSQAQIAAEPKAEEPDARAEETETIEVIPEPKAEEKPQDDAAEIVPPSNQKEEETEQAEEVTAAEEEYEQTDLAEAETSVASTESTTESGEKKKTQYTGKWVFNQVVTVDAAGEEKEKNFFFQLKASNGETLIFSEEYTSLRGANQGVDTFKANIAKDNFKITVSKKGKYVIKLLNGQGSLLAQGAHYNNRAAAQSGVASIKRFAATAVKQDDLQTITLPYEEVTESIKEHDPDKKGKWVIRRAVSEDGTEESYYFELRASNGQLLFTSEEYTSLSGAKVGIGTHKTNIENGNVHPVITRNGDYVLKIYAGNGQLLCLGEHYSNKQLCLNAVESVKRFAETAEIVEDLSQEE